MPSAILNRMCSRERRVPLGVLVPLLLFAFLQLLIHLVQCTRSRFKQFKFVVSNFGVAFSTG